VSPETKAPTAISGRDFLIYATRNVNSPTKFGEPEMSDHHHTDAHGPPDLSLPLVHDLISDTLMIPATAVTGLLRAIATNWTATPCQACAPPLHALPGHVGRRVWDSYVETGAGAWRIYWTWSLGQSRPGLSFIGVVSPSCRGQ
jgi:hypothetical protein